MTEYEIEEQRVYAEIEANPSLAQDQFWRLNNLYWIISKRGKKSLFRMNRAQEHFYRNNYTFFKRIIVLKSRQLGFTTLMALVLLDNTLFNKNKHEVFIAHTQKDATNIFINKVKFAVNNIYPDIKEFINVIQDTHGKLRIGFADNSESTFTVALSARSGTVHDLHVSELAKLCATFPKREEELMSGTIPAVPFDARIVIESTAEGVQGTFYEMFSSALKKLKEGNKFTALEFYPVFYNWTWDDSELALMKDLCIPVHEFEQCTELDWLVYQMENELSDLEMNYYYNRWLSLSKNINKLQQEYPTTEMEAFVASGSPFFPSKKLQNAFEYAPDVVRCELLTGELVPSNSTFAPVYQVKKPEKHVEYIIGGDTSDGSASGDYQALSVLNTHTGNVDCIYRAHVDKFQLANDAIALGKMYNNALVAVETNNGGGYVSDEMLRLGYENIYFNTRLDSVSKETSKKFGWTTTEKSRKYALEEFKKQFTIKKLYYPRILLSEMFSFVINKKGKPEAAPGKDSHDDLVMATGIAYAVMREWGVVSKVDENKLEERQKVLFPD